MILKLRMWLRSRAVTKIMRHKYASMSREAVERMVYGDVLGEQPKTRVWVVSRGLVSWNKTPPTPVLAVSVVGVRSSELLALECIEALDDGLGRYWDIDECTLDDVKREGKDSIHGYGQETWKYDLERLRGRAELERALGKGRKCKQ